MTTRERTRSAIVGALLSGILALVACAFGFSAAALCTVCVVAVAVLAERVRADPS
jgi:hypothetical protein